MKDEIFFDTTVLVYAHDESEPKKRQVCKRLVEEVFKGERCGVISNQVAAELFSVLTKKMRRPLSKDMAEKIVEDFIGSENWVKINYDERTVKNAMFTSRDHNTSFWDALIAETMKENGINKIYTENDEDFKKIPGIKVINPLR